jgi:hypothetical protein
VSAVLLQFDPPRRYDHKLVIEFNNSDDDISIEGYASSQEMALAAVILAKMANDSLDVKS